MSESSIASPQQYYDNVWHLVVQEYLNITGVGRQLVTCG
jgi:hypothetical protein